MSGKINVIKSKSNKEKVESCQICDEACESIKKKQRIYTCHCKVPICNACLTDWTSSQLSEQMMKAKPEFKCPGSNQELKTRIPCKTGLTIEQVVFKMIEVRNRQKDKAI